ncbi:MAG: outer membrane protein assembly factor BamA [Gammaproteobacteria bacterium]
MIRLLCFIIFSFGLSSAWAFDSFVVRNIKVEGLERISEGTVLNAVPLETGETLNQSIASEIVRSVYKTGFFNDVRLLLLDTDLIIVVDERPAISKIVLTGNKDIESDELKEALKNTGLAEGRVFNLSTLATVERELEQLYFNQGKYSVKISSDVATKPNKMVELSIDIVEGKVAKILQINVVGNRHYSDEKLLSKFQLSPFAIFSDNDQYSRRKLTADLESLRSFYLDNGYINFNIASTQVAISPDKNDIYVSVNVSEGGKYTVSDVKLAGQLIVDTEELEKLLLVKKGDVFSRRMITESNTAIGDRLGKEGFAFSNVNAIPEIDEENKQVLLTFFVDPGKRVYVRRVNITGNEKTRDDVIRREIRQMEGGWISTKKVNRSRVRLQRLGYFDEVNVETPTVYNAPDQVDVEFNVTERPSGSLMAGMGYSQAQGLLLNASVSQNNFLGTGKRVSGKINNSDVNTVYNFSFTDPYHTLDGVSRGINTFFKKTDAGQANFAEYTQDTYGASLSYGFPINEFDTASLSIGYENSKINTTDLTTPSIQKFLDDNKTQFDIIKLTNSWAHDTRNRAIFADRGLSVKFSTDIALPGSGLQYYKILLRGLKYTPVSDQLTMLVTGEVGYGNSYGDTTELPFFERFVAGGAHSVRGFKSNSLGPREGGEPIGGAFKVKGNAELIFPVPFTEDNKSLRLSAFFDIGSVYKDYDNFDAGELRYSTGLSAIWMSPIAPLTFSYSWPLNDTSVDETENFQFTLGAFNF